MKIRYFCPLWKNILSTPGKIQYCHPPEKSFRRKCKLLHNSSRAGHLT